MVLCEKKEMLSLENSLQLPCGFTEKQREDVGKVIDKLAAPSHHPVTTSVRMFYSRNSLLPLLSYAKKKLAVILDSVSQAPFKAKALRHLRGQQVSCAVQQ